MERLVFYLGFWAKQKDGNTREPLLRSTMGAEIFLGPRPPGELMSKGAFGRIRNLVEPDVRGRSQTGDKTLEKSYSPGEIWRWGSV